MTAITFPPYRPQPMPASHQDTDTGAFDCFFDADVRRQGHPNAAQVTIEMALKLRTALTDNSKQRNYAWLRWWQACDRARVFDKEHLVRECAPTERPGHPAHERHIKACTTRLLRLLEGSR